jgi:HSP20 family protein
VAVKYVVTRGANRSPERVQHDMEQMFRSMLGSRPTVDPRHNGIWRPPLEVYETEDALVVTVEVAGLDESQVHLTIDAGLLRIRGERVDARQAEKRSYHEARIHYGAFGADVFVPFPVDADRADASYDHGFLRIVLPRQRARTIVPRTVGDERGQE